MSQLIRLVYVSRSTFAPGAAHQGIDSGVARILAKSRKNNAARGIVGGLLFGDGCFLQCLEGDAGAVDELYKIIRCDNRHRDVTELFRSDIDQTSFGAWSMKYALGEETLRRMMLRMGKDRFDPYAMSSENISAVVAYMEREADLKPSVESDDRSVQNSRKVPVSFIDTFKSEHPIDQTVSTFDGAAAVKPGINTIRRIAIRSGVGLMVAMILIGLIYLLGRI